MNHAGLMPEAGRKTIAVTRVLTGIIFLFFGEYKIAGPEFAHTSFGVWVRGWLGQNEPVGFYGAFLEKFVLVHPVLCAKIVGWGELAIGIALVLGLFVRVASVGGAIHMISLALATWYAPGARRGDVEIFRRESGPYSAAIFVRGFLRDARGRNVGVGRAANQGLRKIESNPD